MSTRTLTFAKGHGTGNDFVVVPDPDGVIELSAADVAALCDRRRGLGGDGLLRVVRTAAHPDVADRADQADWFLDYRNADGSLAEMCGNGVRVYARYLVESGLIGSGLVGSELASGARLAILTRAGRVLAEVGPEQVAVDMPLPQLGGPSMVTVDGVEYPGTMAVVGNPNLVCWVDDPGPLDLTAPLTLDPTLFPAGANVEFVTWAGPGQVRMRVVERGVGETLSCGSGACAVAAVAQADARSSGPITVDVPGGRLTVDVTPARCVLTGPAVIVATGTVQL